ncbi:RNA-binding protein [Actinoplanes philippinensis]|uniref:RNA-binding protein n=1 Tax=Actinoplanes philippinensis TaxID=35752 RepID=UPI0033DC9F97
MAAARRIAAEYRVDDLNLVKPGIGETTRVLLRRVPWRVLIDGAAGPEVDHVRLLAAQRGVPVETVHGLPFRSVGLVRRLAR